jgi:hypothetical protein
MQTKFEAVSGAETAMTVYSGSAMVEEGAPRAGIGIMLQPVMPGGQASPALPGAGLPRLWQHPARWLMKS